MQQMKYLYYMFFIQLRTEMCILSWFVDQIEKKNR